MTLKEFNIKSGRIKKLTGVWVDINSPNPKKICAMGVKSSRWVTMHGLALNVSTDLSYFNNIIPCGINDKEVTSIEKETNNLAQGNNGNTIWARFRRLGHARTDGMRSLSNFPPLWSAVSQTVSFHSNS